MYLNYISVDNHQHRQTDQMPKPRLQFLAEYLKFSNVPIPISAPLTDQKITIPNPHQFVDKINQVRDCGAYDNIEFISDYDYTLTKFKHNNRQCDSLFGLWTKGEQLPKQFIEEVVSNYRIFGPYQTDDSLSFDDRVGLVNQLYINQLKAFEKHKITEEMAAKVLAGNNIVFRAQTQQLLAFLHQLGIPLYIISGGISDFIYNTLQVLCGTYYPNISIRSNQFQVYNFSMPDQQQQFRQQSFVRFRDNIVHSYNKYKVMNHEKKRKNCVLMGDLVSDIYMAEGNGYENIISVFYGKHGENHQRALAEEKFDIIVEGDCSHKIVIEVMKLMGRQAGVDWKYLRSAHQLLSELLI